MSLSLDLCDSKGSHTTNEDAQHWIKALKLTRSDTEGVYLSEFYRSSDTFTGGLERFGNKQTNFATSVYGLINGHGFKSFHALKSDEIFHHYQGEALTIYVINGKSGNVEVANIGPGEDHNFAYVVNQGNYFACQLKNPNENNYCLFGATVTPGFDVGDCDCSSREELVNKYPQHASLITKFTLH